VSGLYKMAADYIIQRNIPGRHAQSELIDSLNNGCVEGNGRVQQLPVESRASSIGLELNLIQVGFPRSASTYQFAILCVLAHLKYYNVICGYEAERFGSSGVLVSKLHPYNQTFFLDNKTFLFSSTFNSLKDWGEQKVTWRGGDVAITQRYQDVSECPECQIKQYIHMFNASAQEEVALRQYLKYWVTLRRCCGLQQSLSRMKWLQGCDHQDLPSECFVSNLTRVEKLMESTPIYQRNIHLLLPHHRHKHWIRPGDCEHYDDMIRSGKGFNGKKITYC